MKKIIIAISVMALCLSTMPVMAAERTIDKGGMTVSYSEDEYTAYTESEFVADDLLGMAGDVVDAASNFHGSDWKWGLLGASLTALGITWYDTTSKFDKNTELLIFDEAGKYAFEIFCMDDACMDLDDWAWYNLSRELLSDSPENEDRQLINFLSDLGYYEEVKLFSGVPARALRTPDAEGVGEVPYLYIDEVANSGNACCRLAEIMYNGYEDRVLFIDYGETKLSDEAEGVFNTFMQSISIAPSANKQERVTEKYQRFLHDRVDIID